jgi:hypothetical protein
MGQKSMQRTVIAAGLMALPFAAAVQGRAPVSKTGPEQKKLEVWVGEWTYGALKPAQWVPLAS